MLEDFRSLVNERGRELRLRSRAQLLELQDCPTETVQIDGQVGTIDLIVEEEPEGSLRVVIQGFLDTKWLPRLGIKNVALDGFRIHIDDSIHPLRDEEFYEFD